MRRKKLNDNELFILLINKMFEFAEIDMTYDKLIESGVTKSDMLWMDNYSMTKEQFNKFRLYGVKLLRENYKFRIRKAETEFAWFDLMYGIRVIDTKETSSLEFEDLA